MGGVEGERHDENKEKGEEEVVVVGERPSRNRISLCMCARE